MGSVRPFVETDSSQVAHLHHRVFAPPRPFDDALEAAYRAYFSRELHNSSGADASCPSLVFEEGGKITGFLAVVHRPMKFRGKAIRAAVSSQFVVDPASRGLAGIQIMKSFFEGPQDLSLTDEANDDSRRLWEAMGGATSFPLSGLWFMPLRPVTFGLEMAMAGQSGRRKVTRALLRPFTRIADQLAARLPKSPFRISPPAFLEEPLSAQGLIECRKFNRASLLPCQEPEAIERLIARAASLQQHGRLAGVLLKTRESQVAGCFLYYQKPGGLSEVVHIASHPRFSKEAVDQLFAHAASNGVTAVTGRLSPQFLRPLSMASCLLSPRANWMLVHSRDPEIGAAVCSGDAALSALDGEWPLHFNYLGAAG